MKSKVVKCLLSDSCVTIKTATEKVSRTQRVLLTHNQVKTVRLESKDMLGDFDKINS